MVADPVEKFNYDYDYILLIIKRLEIPPHLKLDAIKEGLTALSEKREPAEALRYWYEGKLADIGEIIDV